MQGLKEAGLDPALREAPVNAASGRWRDPFPAFRHDERRGSKEVLSTISLPDRVGEGTRESGASPGRFPSRTEVPSGAEMVA